MKNKETKKKILRKYIQCKSVALFIIYVSGRPFGLSRPTTSVEEVTEGPVAIVVHDACRGRKRASHCEPYYLRVACVDDGSSMASVLELNWKLASVSQSQLRATWTSRRRRSYCRDKELFTKRRRGDSWQKVTNARRLRPPKDSEET